MNEAADKKAKINGYYCNKCGKKSKTDPPSGERCICGCAIWVTRGHNYPKERAGTKVRLLPPHDVDEERYPCRCCVEDETVAGPMDDKTDPLCRLLIGMKIPPNMPLDPGEVDVCYFGPTVASLRQQYGELKHDRDAIVEARGLEQDEMRRMNAENERLRTCPVCEEKDSDMLEACSGCYNSHFKSTLKLSELQKDNEALNKQLKELKR